MLGMPTSRYTIIRGEELTDDYGDTYVTDVPLYFGVQGSVIEKKREVFNPEDNRIAVVRILTGRFGPNTDIQDADRIKDEKSGETYLVSSVFHPQTLGGFKSDVLVDLVT